MFINAIEYVKIKTKTERQAHLDLNELCWERGGNSTNHRGVLAQFLGTTIPAGRTILAHACNNKTCSNPKHLYWASDKENIVEDNSEWKCAWDRSVAKYGLEEAKRRNASGNKSAGGKANLGKKKSEEHKRKIAEAIKRKHAEKKQEI